MAAFWQTQINQDTGRPFQSAEEFNAKARRMATDYSPLIDALVSQYEKANPGVNRKAMRSRFAKYMAAHQSPPSDPEGLKKWTADFMAMSQGVYGHAMNVADAEAAGWTQKAIEKDPEGFRKWEEAHAAEIAGPERGESVFSSPTSAQYGVSVQNQEDEDPGSITGKKEDDYAKRLQEFKDALFNPQVAQRLAGMAASQSERASYGAGIRGGAQTQGINQAVADAGIQYDQNVNSQALQYMGVENARVANAEQASLMRAQFNAQQQALAAGQRQQMGGTVGGIIGGVVGSLPALFPGGQGVAAITAPALSGIGAGIGSAAASSPGFGSYGGGNRRSGSGGSNGISGA